MSISVDNIEGQIPRYKFKNSGWIYYKFCQSKRVRDVVFHTSVLKNIKLESTSTINNVILTIFSKYKTIKRNYLLNQPRPILESKILKHIHNSDFRDKLTKYYFLSKIYELFTHI